VTLPITIIGGYLGSGKTTLVNHLLRNADGKRLAVLVNEFGELPIDADLIEGQDGDVIALAGGCVCCSYGDDLTSTLIDMAKGDPAPDHVLLEASGVAIPGAIAASLSLLSDFQLASIVVVADAETVMDRTKDHYVGGTVNRQLLDANLLLLNKIDLVADEEAKSVVQQLLPLTSGAVILPVENGEVGLDIVLSGVEQLESKAFAGRGHEAAIFATRSFELPDRVESEALKRWLFDNKTGLVRAKGFALSENGELQSIQLAGDRIVVVEAAVDAKPAIALIGLRDHAASQNWLAMDEAAFVEAVSRA